MAYLSICAAQGDYLGEQNDNRAPAVFHWVAPSVISPPPPWESWCWKMPSIM
jgi:hypothetical protein